MNIASEQEMLAFGTQFAHDFIDDRIIVFRDHTRPTGSGTSEVSPATTGANERVEKSNFQSPVIELIGDVGAGKTTFVRGLAQGLGIKEPVTSPSFTISKSYALPSGGNLIHYDFYRLSDPGLMSEDLAEAISNPQNIVVIEWADSISDILPQNHTKITINYNNDDTRKVTIS